MSLAGARPHMGSLPLGGSRVSFQVLKGLATPGAAKPRKATRPRTERDSVMRLFLRRGARGGYRSLLCGRAAEDARGKDDEVTSSRSQAEPGNEKKKGVLVISLVSEDRHEPLL